MPGKHEHPYAWLPRRSLGIPCQQAASASPMTTLRPYLGASLIEGDGSPLPRTIGISRPTYRAIRVESTVATEVECDHDPVWCVTRGHKKGMADRFGFVISEMLDDSAVPW